LTTAVASPGILSTSVNSIPGPISLTDEGPTDWTHWGDTAHKASNGSSIGYSLVGTGQANQYFDDQRGISWTDGSPIAQATDNRTGLYVSGAGAGFSLTAPASTTSRVLRVHVGGWNSGGQLRAEMSDGSVVPYVDTTPSVGGSYYRDYTLTYKAASAGQTLNVSWTMAAGGGNVTLASAALNAPDLSAPAPPSSSIPTGWVYLVSQNSGKCADVEGISLDPGARIHQWDCLGADNQKFQFVPVSGGYKVNIAHSGLQFDVEGGPGAVGDGPSYVQYPYWGGSNEIFQPKPMGDGTYEIIANNSGKCMDVENVSKDNGAYIHQWTCLGAPNQKWSIVPVP
jgi:hypothetical protein